MPDMLIVYGIPNCDTVKKARAWLDSRGLEYRFHDFKKEGVPADRLAAWLAQPGWQALLNRKGTTWRKLDPATQQAVQDAASAGDLMLSEPSAIKRPVADWGGQVTVGFDPQAWGALATRQ